MAYMFGIDSILRELKRHYLVERFYTSDLSQGIFVDKNSVFSFFRMGNISQNMECESNPCLNWNWDTDASSSLLNQTDSYLKGVDNKFFQNWLFVLLLEVFQKCLRSALRTGSNRKMKRFVQVIPFVTILWKIVRYEYVRHL